MYDELVIIVRGDVNSDAAINLNDSKLVEDYVRYIEELDEIALIAANVERDDSVNLNDSKKIIDFVRYIIDSLND
ncbi:MAG: hypothetical protein GX038_03255 [Erysipelothrix sp.]|nr:hypothetical protein [Erysipelothrix sp.]